MNSDENIRTYKCVRFMKQNVTNKVFELRTQAGVTQQDLAQAVGVTRQTIITLEKDSCAPSVCLALRIARYFSLPVESVFILIEKQM